MQVDQVALDDGVVRGDRGHVHHAEAPQSGVGLSGCGRARFASVQHKLHVRRAHSEAHVVGDKVGEERGLEHARHRPEVERGRQWAQAARLRRAARAELLVARMRREAHVAGRRTSIGMVAEVLEEQQSARAAKSAALSAARLVVVPKYIPRVATLEAPVAEFAGYGPIALGVADRCARAAATAWLGQVALAGDTSGREFGHVALTPGRPDAVEVAVLYKPASDAAVTRAQGRGSKGVAKEAELAGILPARDRGGEHRGGEHIRREYGARRRRLHGAFT